jgi:hypothetical protein
MLPPPQPSTPSRPILLPSRQSFKRLSRNPVRCHQTLRSQPCKPALTD